MSDELLAPHGRVILISGASRGIGAAIARRLHADGYTLSLGARDPKAASDALGAHDQARVMTARFDALDVDSARQWIAATVERFGRIDGLINNAGILRMVRFDEGDEAAMNEMWSVNVMAPFRLLRLALPHLRRAGHGRVVNFASTDAKRGNTTYEAIVEDRLRGCPAGRFADPAECGDLIAYICSAQAGFMTGQNIINDGGVYQGLF